MYLGTVVEEGLKDLSILKELDIVKSETSPNNSWHLHNVRIPKEKIVELQTCLRDQEPWYMHFWKGDKITVVFKDKTFTISASNKSTWGDAVDYGLSIGIPKRQLDFLIVDVE